MNDIVQQALALWGLEGADCVFVAGRENQVYRINTQTEAYALRLKRPGYRTHTELESELAWIAEMDRAGLHVPRPRPSRSGVFLERVGDRTVDLITWLDGQPLGRSNTRLDLEDAPGVFFSLGQTLARLHQACDAWQPPASFSRWKWDAEGLIGEAPVWGRFWNNPLLDADTSELLNTFRSVASDVLQDAELDFGLIHADPVRENVLLHGQEIRLIDFDDGGYGFRLFDLATALVKNRIEPRFDQLQEALIDGYLSIRFIDLTHLKLFLALRAVTYLGWIVPRIDEPGALDRNARFIADARAYCGAYLSQTKAI